jgi:hypothetical protein
MPLSCRDAGGILYYGRLQTTACTLKAQGRRGARAGDVPHRRFGKYVRYDRQDVLAWADKQTKGRAVGMSPLYTENSQLVPPLSEQAKNRVRSLIQVSGRLSISATWGAVRSVLSDPPGISAVDIVRLPPEVGASRPSRFLVDALGSVSPFLKVAELNKRGRTVVRALVDALRAYPVAAGGTLRGTNTARSKLTQGRRGLGTKRHAEPSSPGYVNAGFNSGRSGAARRSAQNYIVRRACASAWQL